MTKKIIVALITWSWLKSATYHEFRPVFTCNFMKFIWFLIRKLNTRELFLFSISLENTWTIFELWLDFLANWMFFCWGGVCVYVGIVYIFDLDIVLLNNPALLLIIVHLVCLRYILIGTTIWVTGFDATNHYPFA